MRCAVIQFPGSNCDHDALLALRSFPDVTAEMVWHRKTSLEGFDVIVIPGGFSYGDYLRCGAIARFSPIMKALALANAEGKLILGICNGFQILCELRLLPGTLIRNRGLLFRCEHRFVRIESNDAPFTSSTTEGALLRLPIAHGEGCYIADESTLVELNKNKQVLLRYCDAAGKTTQEANPNGSLENIAGICNRERNVFGLMPHPERASEALLGGTDGRLIFQSMIESLQAGLIKKN